MSERDTHSQEVKNRSQAGTTTSKLAACLYLLTRDHLPMAIIEEIIRQVEPQIEFDMTNGWLQHWAEFSAERILRETPPDANIWPLVDHKSTPYRIIRRPNTIVPYPPTWSGYYNGCRVACDTLQGPCVCGATHSLSEWAIDVSRSENS